MAAEQKLDKPGYHLAQIPKGILGDSSKIMEEVLELLDAEKQSVSIMALVELSDMIGAIRHYLKKNFPATTLKDLEKMADVTERAFANGHRT